MDAFANGPWRSRTTDERAKIVEAVAVAKKQMTPQQRLRLTEEVDWAVYTREENSSVSLGEYHRARLADVLEGYRKYDFEHDQRFQSGLSRIKATGDDLSVEQERMRVFYFSKFVQSIDWVEYDMYVFRPDQSALDPNTLQLIASLAVSSPPTATTTAVAFDAADRLSFQQVMDLVQRGEPVPGIRQIPNTVSTLPPSQATMAPRPKPWERGNAASDVVS